MGASRSKKVKKWLPPGAFLLALALSLAGLASRSAGPAGAGTASVSPGPMASRGASPVFPPAELPRGRPVKVALAYADHEETSRALMAYRQVLEEEGFPFELLPLSRASSLGPAELKDAYAAIILPEEINRQLSLPLAARLEEYVLTHGGKLWVGRDVGTLDAGGAPLVKGALARLVGAGYGEGVGEEYPGSWIIPPGSPLRGYFDPGLFDGDPLRIYGYPALQDLHRSLEGVSATVLAIGRETPAGPEQALVTEKVYPRGGVAFFTNARLALHKYQANDDFILRAPLKYFLLERVRLPRLVASPGGGGGLAIAVHVDSGKHLRYLDRIFSQNLFSREIPFSIHLTAGPDDERPGDGLGINVENPAVQQKYVRRLASYGSIGSHGGWRHNYWAREFDSFSEDERREYIDSNYRALTVATGQAVVEYSAPGGLHSPAVNDYIAAWGTVAASVPNSYYSPPTHAWFDGRREDRFWLFGYTGTRYGMALENMLMEGRSPRQIVADTRGVVDTVVGRREIRLYYFHPVSVGTYPLMWKEIQNYILHCVRQGRLVVRTMSGFAAFLNRHRKVRFSVSRAPGGYTVEAEGPESLREMTFALPLGGGQARPVTGLRLREEGDWAYFTVEDDVLRVRFRVEIEPRAGVRVATLAGHPAWGSRLRTCP